MRVVRPFPNIVCARCLVRARCNPQVKAIQNGLMESKEIE